MSALYTTLKPERERVERKRSKRFGGLSNHQEKRTEPKNKFTVATFTSRDEQSGTTTSLISVASMMRISSAYDTRVAVLDLNMRNPDVYYSTISEEVKFLSLSERMQIGSALLPSYRMVTEAGVDCFTLLGDKNLSDQEIHQYEQFLSTLSRTYDIVLVNADTYKSNDLYTSMAFDVSDIVICVVKCDEKTLGSFNEDIPRLLDSKEKGGIGLPEKKTGVILNKVHSMLEAHKMTESIREKLPIVGSIPELSKQRDPKVLLDEIIHDRKSAESLYTTIQNIM